MATASPALIPVKDRRRAPHIRSGRTQSWEVTSTDGLWWFLREETAGTPWWAIYVPTGQETWFGSERKARLWAAKPSAVESLRQEALAALTYLNRGIWFGDRVEYAQLVADRERVAGRALRIHTGRIVLPSPDRVAESACVCGGRLTTVDGLWAHLDVCHLCEGHDRCGPQMAYRIHPAGCDYPEPEPCRHLQCVAPNDLTANPCVPGQCCGRCGKC